MKPQIAIDTVLQQASVLLADPLTDGRAAEMGADHLVVFATTPTYGRVAIKIGEDAETDAYVLEQLRDVSVKTPLLLAHGQIEAGRQRYPIAIMTRIEGVDLAIVADPHHYLPELMMQIQRVHQGVIGDAAGTVRDVMQSNNPTSWKAYLVTILRGDNPEFDWDSLCASPFVDAVVLRQAISSLLNDLGSLQEPEKYHLLHGDLNPYNILVNSEQITGIIDWSYARYGDPLFDFARLRMNPFIRRVPLATETYFSLLDFTQEEKWREALYYKFNLIEYVNWYVQSNSITRVREHIALLQ